MRLAPKDFVPDGRLTTGTALVGELALSRVFLVDDSRFPWLVLVPRLEGACEIADLAESDALQLMREARLASVALRKVATFDKLNVASLGNMVPQLHLHVVARLNGDAAWPGPVFGVPGGMPYKPEARDALCVALREALGL